MPNTYQELKTKRLKKKMNLEQVSTDPPHHRSLGFHSRLFGKDSSHKGM